MLVRRLPFTQHGRSPSCMHVCRGVGFITQPQQPVPNRASSSCDSRVQLHTQLPSERLVSSPFVLLVVHNRPWRTAACAESPADNCNSIFPFQTLLTRCLDWRPRAHSSRHCSGHDASAVRWSVQPASAPTQQRQRCSGSRQQITPARARQPSWAAGPAAAQRQSRQGRQTATALVVHRGVRRRSQSRRRSRGGSRSCPSARSSGCRRCRWPASSCPPRCARRSGWRAARPSRMRPPRPATGGLPVVHDHIIFQDTAHLAACA